MVHRPADSRLLTNLLQHEKEYSKQLAQLLDSSNASLASFTAYAAASSPPASQVILSVAASLAAADEALKRYADGVDQWRDSMRHLKDMEEEVGNIMRDREILVTRLIKASKSQKNSPGNIRESLLLSQQQKFPSSSSLSLQDTTSSASRPLSLTSSKLTAAQSELQACETHLAAKERELALKRAAAVRVGLGARMKAMVECAWAWGELGRESLRTLDTLEQRPPQSSPTKAALPDDRRPSSDVSSIGPSQSASQTNHESPMHIPPPLPIISFGDPNPNLRVPAIDTSIRPSSIASTVYYTPEQGSTDTHETDTGTDTITYTPQIPPKDSRPVTPFAPVTSEIYKDEWLHNTVTIPAPHALEGYAYDIPTATPIPASSASGVGLDLRPLIERRITEEDELRRSSSSYREPEAKPNSSDEDSSPEDANVSVVENPRFMTEARKAELEREKKLKELKEQTAMALREAEERKVVKENSEDRAPMDSVQERKKERRFTFLTHSSSHSQPADAGPSTPHTSPSKASIGTGSSSPSKGFLGSIRGLFSSKSPEKDKDKGKDKDKSSPSKLSKVTRAPAQRQDADDTSSSSDDSDDESPSRHRSQKRGGLQGLFRSGGGQGHGAKHQKHKSELKWNTRTDKNIRELHRRGSFDDNSLRRRPALSSDAMMGPSAAAVARAGIVDPPPLTSPTQPARPMSGDADGFRFGGPRARAASDVGAVSPLTTVSEPKRLKKSRAGAGPPVAPSASTAVNVDQPFTQNQRPPATTSTPRSRPPANAANVKKAGHRRSASVDLSSVNRKSFIETQRQRQQEEREKKSESEGEDMIIDLGQRRRRATSELGGNANGEAAANAAAAVTQMNNIRAAPTRNVVKKGPPSATSAVKAKAAMGRGVGVGSGTDKEYASDTAALGASIKKKKSLSKKKDTPPARASSVASTSFHTPPRTNASLGTPAMIPVPTAPILSFPPPSNSAMSTSPRKAPGKTQASAHPSSSQVSLVTSRGQTVPAGGDNPSGTLVSQPGSGWGVQAPAPGGVLSRNSSINSAGAAVPRAGKKTQQTSLGQGMGGGMGRRASVTSSAGLGPSGSTATLVPTPSASTNPPVQPNSTSSLMSIIEGVSKSNRNGWSSSSDIRKSVGGSKVPVGMVEVVKAPPRAGRSEIAAMDSASPSGSRFGSVASAGGSGAAGTSRSSALALFEIKAPGSVFDEGADARQQQQVPSTSTSRTLVNGVATSVVKSPQKHQHEATGSTDSTTASGGSMQTQKVVARAPLRGVLKNYSPSPSPSPQPGPSNPLLPQERDPGLPRLPPHDGPLPWGPNGILNQPPPTRVDKGKGRAPPEPDSADESAGGSSTGNEVFYSDEEDVPPAAAVTAQPPPIHSVLRHPQIPNGSALANGHAAGYGSEQSESTASTALAGKSSLSRGASLQNGPRRRKSVRVSLQPTFSPSPPAIEYDDEEEARNHAPYVWKPYNVEQRQQQHHQPLVVPTPVSPAKQKAVADVVDRWVDSSDEDEDYANARKALSRAAKKEKEVALLAANR